MQTYRALVKDLVPPAVLKTYRRLVPSPYGWFGNYPNWEAARSDSTGYDAGLILEKVKAALLKVKRGEAVYERDSVLFDQVQYSWPLLAGLMWIAAQRNGRLNVMDLGGSLGSTYFQNQRFLAALEKVTWGIVEQENFVRCGKESFEDGTLKFYYRIEEYLRENQPDVLLLSSVLPYVEKPYDLLQTIFEQNIPFIIVDHMPLVESSQDRLTLQKVSPQIYEASYPCWLLSRPNFLQSFESHYRNVTHFSSEFSILLDGKRIQYEGFIFQKKD